MQIREFQKGDYRITTDRAMMDIQVIHDFLSNDSYWSRDIPMHRVERSVRNSLNFGLFHDGIQVGYARVISDFATIAYLGDIFILPAHRGKGLSKWMIECVMADPDLQGLRRWILLTSTAHGLYEKFGWQKLPKPELYMELHDPNVYKK